MVWGRQPEAAPGTTIRPLCGQWVHAGAGPQPLPGVRGFEATEQRISVQPKPVTALGWCQGQAAGVLLTSARWVPGRCGTGGNGRLQKLAGGRLPLCPGKPLVGPWPTTIVITVTTSCTNTILTEQ